MSDEIRDSRSNRSFQAEPSSSGAPRSRWQRFWLVVKVVELRLRFIALLGVTGLTFAYWDTIWNHYEKWTRPTAAVHVTSSALEFYCPMHPNVVQGAAGTCPICGMTLSKRGKHAANAVA